MRRRPTGPGRGLGRIARPLAGLGIAAGLTAWLSLSATSAAFTARTGDTANQVSSAASFCTSPGLQPTLFATEDTAGYESSPNTNFGTNVQIGALSATGANTRSFLRFTLPPLNGCQVTGATLSLYASAPTAGRSIDVYRVDPAAPLWTELGLKWSNMPGTAGLPVTSPSLASANWQTWGVTSIVATFYSSGVNSGFMLRDSVDNASPSKANYYESNNSTTPANKPKLALTFG